jgi:TolB-like protein
MGEVYRTRDPRLGRDVAIKIMPAAFSTDADRVRRFEQEARAAAALNHPNILSVHDVGTYDGKPYIVSELLEGETLHSALRQRTVPIQKALQYAIEVCHGLAAAHENGIIHRDLKPENLFVTRDGYVKILDFGLAKLVERQQSVDAITIATGTVHTTPGTVMGTVGYMSPEQACGRAVDHRTDIFSFGTILYELVAGRRAFTGNSAVETLSAILKEQPAELTSHDPASVSVNRIIQRCLEKDPAQRFQSARDLAYTLEAITSAGWPSSAVRDGRTASSAPTLTSAGPFRLIVLAFENLSRQPEDDWLAGAFADSLTLGLRDAQNIIIVNREHAGAGADPRQLFEMLDVRYCVKGSYQRVGDELKVVARLVHADTGAIAVQESLTDRFSNLLSLEDMIAGRFVTAFQQPKPESIPNRTSSLAAYKRLAQARELHLTGRYHDAAHHLEVAVGQDPQYADAWALLANSYARLTSPATSNDDAREEFQRRALTAAQRAAHLDSSLYEAQIALALASRGVEDVELWRTAALKATELNPRVAEAYVLLGQSYFASPAWGWTRHRDADLAERYFRKALQLDPRFGLGHNALIYHLTWVARAADALRAADEAVRLLPDHVDLLRARATALLWLGRADEAEAQLRHLAVESAASTQDEWQLAAIDLLRGRVDRAATRFQTVIERGPQSLREIETALIYCGVGQFLEAAAHLRAALAVDPACATFVEHSPAFDTYRETLATDDVSKRTG